MSNLKSLSVGNTNFKFESEKKIKALHAENSMLRAHHSKRCSTCAAPYSYFYDGNWKCWEHLSPSRQDFYDETPIPILMEAMKTKTWSMSKLARVADIDVNQVNRYFKNPQSNVTFRIVLAMFRALDVSGVALDCLPANPKRRGIVK